MRKILFVIGGEKSGKSFFAQKVGENIGGKKAYIATATPIDEEMERRIKKHRMDRDSSWTTFEEPLKVAEVIESTEKEFNVILIDCLTIWVSNLMYHGLDVDYESKKLLQALSKRGTNFVIVSNEVGLGVVPESPLGREFRTVMGTLNQAVADLADTVFFMIAGIPMEIKSNTERRQL